jgi:ribosome production factor 1
MKRKREEQKRPELREERISKNVPVTIESKRVWDEPVGDEDDALGWAIDVERLAKRQKTEENQRGAEEGDEEEGVLAQLKKRDQATDPDDDKETDEEADSMLGSDDEFDDESDDESGASSSRRQRAPSPSAASTTATYEARRTNCMRHTLTSSANI